MEQQNENKQHDGEVRPFDALVIPPMDFELETILGMANFKCGSIARNLRNTGHEIPEKAEKEQAYVIYFMLKLYEEHGKNWRLEFANKMKRQAV